MGLASIPIARWVVPLVVASYPIFACTCSYPDAREAVRQADFVFRGKLAAVEYVDPPRSIPHILLTNRMVPVPRRFLATIEVDGVWKGRVGSQIVLHTREGATDCVGFWTTVGKEVLVFANEELVQEKQPNVWRIPEWSDKVAVGQRIVSPGVCTLNGEIENASRTLKKLGRFKRPSR